MNHKNPKFSISALIIILFDIIVSSILIFKFDFYSFAGIIAIAYIILIDLIIILFLKVFNSRFIKNFYMNLIAAPVIFILFLVVFSNYLISKDNDVTYFLFKNNNYRYELCLYKNKQRYAMYQQTDSLSRCVKYEKMEYGDTIFLTIGPQQRALVYKGRLIGYPSLRDTIVLKKL
jgi:hypothetical protein